MSNAIRGRNWFKIFDRLFWLVWVGLPIVFYTAYREVFSETAIIEQLIDLPANCIEKLPLVANFSSEGQFLVTMYLIVQFAMYAALLWIAHHAIHGYAKGKIFVASTLKTLGILGVFIMAWPFVDLIMTNLLSYGTTRTGDTKVFSPNYFFDFGPFGVGLLIVTLRLVLSQAIAMKQDNDLTI